jgi:SnoaL-like domain
VVIERGGLDVLFGLFPFVLGPKSNPPLPEGRSQMSSQQEPTAVAVARAHVDAWGNHDYESARAALAPDVHVVVTSIDPDAPDVDTTGIEEYMDGLVQFGQAVVPGASHVNSATGDEARALLQVTSRVKFGPNAPEMTLHGARLYRLDENQKIADEQVIFFVIAQ